MTDERYEHLVDVFTAWNLSKNPDVWFGYLRGGFSDVDSATRMQARDEAMAAIGVPAKTGEPSIDDILAAVRRLRAT